MTRYLLSMPHDSAEEPTMATMDPAELEAALAAAGAFMEELSASGALVFAGGLHPPSTAVTVDDTGDDLDLVDAHEDAAAMQSHTEREKRRPASGDPCYWRESRDSD